jgi:hypothetical protein
MATNVFKGPSTTSIPRSDGRIVRVPLDKSDIGARKSHIAGTLPKNDYSIAHVGKK